MLGIPYERVRCSARIAFYRLHTERLVQSTMEHDRTQTNARLIYRLQIIASLLSVLAVGE